MKTESPFELPTFEVMGYKLKIHFNHDIVDREDMEGGHTQSHVYDTAVVSKTDSRDTIIESILRVFYPTYGAEIAAMQNTPVIHGDHRDQAKQLADEWFGVASPETTLLRKRKRMNVTRFQAKAALIHFNLLNQMESYVESSTDPLVALAWQEAGFERLSGFVETAKGALGLTDEQMDSMFEYAMTVS